jgi:hypothetical protein
MVDEHIAHLPTRPGATRPTPIKYNENRPHPFVNPLNKNGIGLSHNTPGFNELDYITIRNPIKQMKKGTSSGLVDWHATAIDLAKNLHDTRRAMASMERAFTEELKYHNETIARLHRTQYAREWLKSILTNIQRAWWYRLFTARIDKRIIAQALKHTVD